MGLAAGIIVTPLAGCGPALEGGNPDPRCQPIAPTGGAPAGEGGGACFLPFPSAFYERRDPTSETGLRVAIPAAALPRNQAGVAYDVSRLALLDGFSPATQIVVDLGARVDASRLIPVDGDYGAALRPDAPVQLIAYDTGERVPLFAEVDAHVADRPQSEARQVVLIHPMIRLRPSARYVVALVGLRDTAGRSIEVAPFRALVEDRVREGSRLAEVAPRFREIFAMLERQGVPRASLTYAWDFTTASDRQGFGHLVTMRNVGLRRWEKDNLGWKTTTVEEPVTDGQVLRKIRGTFAVPSFLTSTNDRYAGLALDARGQPQDSGANLEARLLIVVPRCAAQAKTPLRLVIYGHGLLGGAEEIESGLHRRISEKLCIIEAATDWIGLSGADVPVLLARVFGDFSNISIPTDRLQQGVLDFLVLARLARRKLKDMPELTDTGKPGGRPLVDGSEVYYLGGSQGGIFGNTLLALSPDLDRGVLNVGGGSYSLMLPRSVDFWTFQKILENTYPDPVDRQILIALSQNYWDHTDPIAFARHVVGDTLPDEYGKPLPPRRALLQESRNDSQVPNVATRLVARTMELSQLDPPVEPVYGLARKIGPLDSAYTQWDIVATPVPSRTNVSGEEDNGAHGALGDIPACVEQMDRFLRPDGRVEHTCNGPCVYPDTPR